MITRKLSHALLSRTESGRIDMVEAGEKTSFGPDGSQPHVTVTVNDPAFHGRLLKGSVGLGTSYMDGLWDTDDLVGLIRIAARNVPRFDRLRTRFRPVIAPAQALTGRLRRNSIERSREQISAHYDLGNDLYELFLDETMMYSAGLFERFDMSLHDAQIAKLDRICRQLELTPDDHLVEIGSGWGALAVHAAGVYGARVTTTTISTEQFALTQDRVRAAGLEDRVTVLLEDYRMLEGTYDKLVSIEMVEAVGWRDFPTYFEACSRLLREDGLMLLQAITIEDSAYEVEKAAKSFINQLIFPGGCLPSLGVIDSCINQRTDMRPLARHDMTADYALTLRHWRERFQAAQPELEQRGYDERFRRLWDLYLAYCEAGFAERRIGVAQHLFAKPAYVASARRERRELIAA